MKWFIVFLSILVLTVTIVGCSSEKSNTPTPVSEYNEETGDNLAEVAENAAKEASNDKLAAARAVSSDVDKPLEQPEGSTKASAGATRAVIETNKGKIVIELYPNKAPSTVANFAKLANSGFYNGIKWHRVEPGFVIQGGDPLSKDEDPNNDGTGGPGYMINAEFNDVKHVKGTVAMARQPQDPNSAGSQFYICLAPAPFLDGQYTVFGQVVEGLDVVDSIQKYDVMEKVYTEN